MFGYIPYTMVSRNYFRCKRHSCFCPLSLHPFESHSFFFRFESFICYLSCASMCVWISLAFPWLFVSSLDAVSSVLFSPIWLAARRACFMSFSPLDYFSFVSPEKKKMKEIFSSCAYVFCNAYSSYCRRCRRFLSWEVHVGTRITIILLVVTCLLCCSSHFVLSRALSLSPSLSCSRCPSLSNFRSWFYVILSTQYNMCFTHVFALIPQHPRLTPPTTSI